jgi:hypothetical protein
MVKFYKRRRASEGSPPPPRPLEGQDREANARMLNVSSSCQHRIVSVGRTLALTFSRASPACLNCCCLLHVRSTYCTFMHWHLTGGCRDTRVMQFHDCTSLQHGDRTYRSKGVSGVTH